MILIFVLNTVYETNNFVIFIFVFFITEYMIN